MLFPVVSCLVGNSDDSSHEHQQAIPKPADPVPFIEART